MNNPEDSIHPLYLAMLAAERALNDYVAKLAEVHALQLRSPLDPLPMTESQLWVLNQLRRQLEAAKHEHYLYLKSRNENRH